MKKIILETEKRLEKLSKKDQEDLIFDLVNALVKAQNVGEAALFLQDLLTKKEAQILSKRLRIAKLLLNGLTYEEIEKDLHVSHSTVAKIAAWLAERGEGFRKIIKKLPERKKDKTWEDLSDWAKFKRQHSLYFWPELLLEGIVKSANKRQKEQIKNVLERLEDKSKLHRQIEKYLKY